MRIVQMHPHEPRTSGVFREPGFCMLHDVHATTLDASPAGLAVGVLRKVVVEIEPAIEAWGEGFGIENDGADESSGVIALCLQQLGPGGVVGRKRNCEICNSVRAGQ